MPRVSRCNPVRDGTHDGDEEPQKNTLHTAKKMSPTTKRTTTRGAASAKTCSVSTKSAKSKGNKIAGMPNKRGNQIVSSSTTRKSPQGTSGFQDTESTQSPTHTPSPKRLHTPLGIKDGNNVGIKDGNNVMGGNRKAPPNTRASGNDVMGGAYSKEQGGTGKAIVVDTPMAAAASTLLYQLQYGGDDGKQGSDHSDASDHLCASSDNDMDY
jgi:hypothetical protein